MAEVGLDDEISDFDYEHYCDGNPIYCYFYRVVKRQKKAKNRSVE